MNVFLWAAAILLVLDIILIFGFSLQGYFRRRWSLRVDTIALRASAVMLWSAVALFIAGMVLAYANST